MSQIFKDIKPYTMTSFPRMQAWNDMIEMAIQRDIPGDIVECGVWKGGCIMIAAHLLSGSKCERKIYGFDTFTGMTKPCDKDFDLRGVSGESRWQKNWCKVTMAEVKRNLEPYGLDRVELVRGDVMNTIPEKLPEKISVCRLDTDFYESTLPACANAV